MRYLRQRDCPHHVFSQLFNHPDHPKKLCYVFSPDGLRLLLDMSYHGNSSTSIKVLISCLHTNGTYAVWKQVISKESMIAIDGIEFACF